jgi:EAL domain-containing protein (putative c-di-GMP-specific phosphodiesterase class I)
MGEPDCCRRQQAAFDSGFAQRSRRIRARGRTLRKFPFDKIKIDRCFISGLSENDDSVAIVQAVANLAVSLRMTTTAEGVETQEQLEIVLRLGCGEVQGFLFSAPRPAEEIVRLLAPAGQTKSAPARAA